MAHLFGLIRIHSQSVNGAVVQVTLRGSATRYALKRCKLDYDKNYRAAIVRELRIMATGHRNLIMLREVSVCKCEVWIAMDLMQCSVFTVLCCRGLPEEHAVFIAKEVSISKAKYIKFGDVSTLMKDFF